MTTEILNELSPLSSSKKNPEPWHVLIKAVNTTDIIGTVLRLHLVLEKTIETYVCIITNQKNLFGFSSVDNEKFIIECSTKLKMAKAIGLPSKLYKASSKINKIRNEIAHITDVTISESDLKSALAHLTQYLAEQDENILKYGLELRESDGTILYNKTFGDKDISNKDKFILIVSTIVNEIHHLMITQSH
ncbi:hypothetical protein NYR68_03585 [Actinobacillus equuli subsp. haemolyticus]|uniref:hypothetical protein n=1 Tax=Actinobacillus equuli TaxID=718 RepID=UPI0024466D46|nr:hypothetical protein [Actinobacillus equuli]WGE51477.1 hypothetical protein NYR68_03585 [Actinobacillus equuli subsp. haemolyticus]